MNSSPPIPLFEVLTEEERQALFQRMRAVEIAAGEVFAREGEPGTNMFVVMSGELHVIKSLGKAEESLLGVRKAGDFIGEASLFSRDSQRTASLRAVTPLSLLEMTHERFDELLQQRPALAYELARTISRRQREADLVIIGDLEDKNQRLAQAYAELKAAQAQIIEKEKLEKELQVARNIQESILPRTIHQLPGASFGARMLPARSVGGDLYDVIPLGDGKMGVMVGDVSDKGVPAAIFMGMVRSLMRAEALRASSPGEALRRLNENLLEMNNSGMFVTILYGVFDQAAHTFTYARGGHELPIVFLADGTLVSTGMSQGMLLGLFPDPPLDERTIALPAGSTLLIYSDGATDANNPLGERVEHERLNDFTHSRLGLPAQAFCDSLLADILAYQAEAAQADDITLLAVVVSA